MPRTQGLPRARIGNRAHRCTETETSEFKILTRSHTAGSPPASFEELTNIPYHCYNVSASARTSGFAWLASA
jgi:hypothetical protein